MNKTKPSIFYVAKMLMAFIVIKIAKYFLKFKSKFEILKTWP